jgi:hypothetical protein
MIFFLIQQRLIEQVPPCTLPPPPPARARTGGKRPKKDPKVGSKEWTDEQEEIKRQRPAQLYRSYRFRVPEDLFSNGAAEERWRGMSITRFALEEGDRLQAGVTGQSPGGDLKPEGGSSGGGGAGSSAAAARKRKAAAEAGFDEDDFVESMHGGRAAGAKAPKAAAGSGKGGGSAAKGKGSKRLRRVAMEEVEEGSGEEDGEGAGAVAAAAAGGKSGRAATPVVVKEEQGAGAEGEWSFRFLEASFVRKWHSAESHACTRDCTHTNTPPHHPKNLDGARLRPRPHPLAGQRRGAQPAAEEQVGPRSIKPASPTAQTYLAASQSASRIVSNMAAHRGHAEALQALLRAGANRVPTESQPQSPLPPPQDLRRPRRCRPGVLPRRRHRRDARLQPRERGVAAGEWVTVAGDAGG